MTTADEKLSVVNKQIQKSKKDDNINSLLRMNNLVYRLPPMSTVVNKRTLARHRFDCRDYNGESGRVANIILNGGENYIDGKNSFLSFYVKLTDGAIETGEFSSALDLIDQVILKTESGVEVERVEKVNLLNRKLSIYEQCDDWRKAAGTMMGYGSGAITAGSTRYFLIPLNYLAGLFNVDKLLPGFGLMSGMRMEIRFAETNIGLKWSADPVGVTYEIKDLSCVLDQYQIADSVLSKLNKIQASQQMEIVFKTYACVSSCISTNCINLDMKKAVSRALSAFAVIRDNDGAAGEEIVPVYSDATVDSFLSEDYEGNVNKFQWNLGSLYFPNHNIQNTTEAYHYALKSFDAIKHKTATVPYDSFATGGDALIAVTLERSDILGLSGFPVSGSRILTLNAGVDVGYSRQIDMFLKYVRVLSINLNKILVKE